MKVKNNLDINTLYKMKPEDDSILLVRSHEDNYLIEKHMPEKYKIGKELVIGRNVHIYDLEKAEDLMNRFVIINLPENYLE